MSECCDHITTHLCQFPTELLIYIFKYLSAKNLMACRRVCKRWKEVIDDLSSAENIWEEYCKQDFETLYLDAKRKSNRLPWFYIYRSLSLWCRLPDATEHQDEFCHSSVVADEIRDLSLLKNGIISVHKRESVVYYDISTLESSERKPVYGDFSRFIEYDDVIIILGNQRHLHIIRKVKNSKNETEQLECTYSNVKNLYMFDKHNIYYVDLTNSIFYLDKDFKATEILINYNESVISLSLCGGSLHILTVKKNIYKYENNACAKLFNLESKKSNIFDCLWRYQFLENFEWFIFYIWLFELRITIPEGPLRFISVIKVYGDVFFIGCNNSIVLIYYKPYNSDGQLDLLNHMPVKEYRFAQREDIPVLSLHPILNIDIVEISGGHKMFVAMAKKLAVVTYKHNFEVVKSKAVLPYVPPGPIVLL